jgi:hypothetical protein
MNGDHPRVDKHRQGDNLSFSGEYVIDTDGFLAKIPLT